MLNIRCSNCGHELHIGNRPAESGEMSYLCGNCDSIIKITFRRKGESSKRVSGRKKVLVAEDTKSVCEMAKDILVKAGFDVVIASNGEEALLLLHKEHPDLLLLDLRMPKKSGFDVLKDMKKDRASRNIPVLAMSAVYRDPSNIRILRELGASGFINKDNFADTVLERVKGCLH